MAEFVTGTGAHDEFWQNSSRALGPVTNLCDDTDAPKALISTPVSIFCYAQNMESRTTRPSRKELVQKRRNNIAMFCSREYSCGCSEECHRQFAYASYEGNYKHKNLLSQKELTSVLTSTIADAVVRDSETGERFIPCISTPFKFGDKKVCAVTFRNLWGLPRASFFRYQKAALAMDGMIPKTSIFEEKRTPKKPFGPCYEAFKDWAMVYMLKGLPQDMPTDGSLQIKRLDYDIEYANYRRQVAEPVHVVNKTFRKYCRYLVKKELNIRIRKKVEVSGMCSICDNLDARWAKLQASDPDPDAWKELTHLKESHSETHKYQRNCYDERRREGADPLGEIDSIALDGAANKNTVVPHAPHQVKHINEKKQNFFNLHLQLTILHGCILLFNLSFPWSQPKGANMMLTSFTNLLTLVAIGHCGKRYFRKTLHLQVDGGSENWNRYTFGFCALLVHYGIYQTVVLHRLMVGHTHNDVDGWFGLMKMYIFGKDATKAGRWLILLEDYINWLISWAVKKFWKVVQVQGQQLDFKTCVVGPACKQRPDRIRRYGAGRALHGVPKGREWCSSHEVQRGGPY